MKTAPRHLPFFVDWYKKFYEKHAPDAVMDPNAPMHWKEKVLYMYLYVLIPVGFLAWVVGMPSNIANEFWSVAIAVTAGYYFCVVIFFLPNVRYVFRACVAASMLYVIGISVILDVGPFKASREWFFFFSIIASIFLGWSGAISSICINLLTWVAIGFLIKSGLWENFYALNSDSALHFWFLIAIDLVTINIITTVTITLFFLHINRSDQAAKTYSQLLLKEGRKLTESHQKLETEIEDRKAVTRALRESEEKYRTILENIEDAYFEVDLEGNLTFFNRSFVERLEYEKDALLGMNYREFTNHKNAERLFKAFQKTYTSTKPGHPIELDVISKNNTIIVTSILVSLLMNNDGKPLGFRGLARDITEHKAMEDRLRQAQKMEAVGTLAGGVAHDLNNILSGVVNYPELLLLNMKADDPMQRPIQAIKKSGEKAVAIVQDLLTLARRGVSIKDTTNLNAIILEYLQSTEFQTLQSFHPNVTIETHFDESLLNISGSPVHLSKTIMNLVSNATEAIMDEGKVVISTENRHIEIIPGKYDSVAGGDYVVLTIHDTGDGIAPDDLDKIFEPFFTKKTMGRSGTGLGMAVVWGTIKDHGGHIDVQSIQGSGTTFTIYFPVSRNEAAIERPKVSMEHLKGNGETILVVDDVETQREIATDMLMMLGYSVNAARSGEEAVEHLQRTPADLMLLDMIMRPGMDGLETYQKVLSINPVQKAIIASGFSETDQVRETQRLGAGEYIRKPYSLQTLGLAVKKELKRPRDFSN